jgi:hypothetical protein
MKITLMSLLVLSNLIGIIQCRKFTRNVFDEISKIFVVMFGIIIIVIVWIQYLRQNHVKKMIIKLLYPRKYLNE